jgi:phosphocarrier protein HPr
MTTETTDGAVERTFEIRNRLGLHARAAAQLVRIANRHSCTVTVGREGMAVNGKSIMGVLMLAAPRGSRVTIRAEGEEAGAAVAEIGELIDNKFGEE